MKLKGIKDKFKFLWEHKVFRNLNDAAGSATIGVLFLLSMGHLLSGVASFIVLPVAIGTNLMHAALDIRDAYKSRKKSDASNAVASTITALGVIAAVVCTFVGGAVLGTIAPAILTGVLGFRTLYDLGAGCYYWYKYHKYKYTNPQKAAAYYEQAKEHTISFVVAALATGASAGALIANKSSFGAIGVAAGIIGTGYASYGIYKIHQEYKARKNQASIAPNVVEPQQMPLSTNALLHQQIGFNPQPVPAPLPLFQNHLPEPVMQPQPTLFFEIYPKTNEVINQPITAPRIGF